MNNQSTNNQQTTPNKQKESKKEELVRVPVETIRAYYGIQFFTKLNIPASLIA